MAKTSRTAASMAVVAVILTVPAAVFGSHIQATPDAIDAHVRSHSPVILNLIAQAADRSATFRQLIATITASDAVVYVEEGDCGHGVRACFHAVSAAGGHRILWVRINARNDTDDHLMGTIGHELRHTVEVLENRWVTTTAAMTLMYLRIGYSGTGSGSRETVNAVRAGNAVRAEVRTFDRQKNAK